MVAAVNRYMEDVRDHGRNSYPEWCRYADETIKARIGRLIGAHRDEIAFVKNTTEGLVNVANGFPWRDGDNLILPDIEYPSNVLLDEAGRARRHHPLGQEPQWPHPGGRHPQAHGRPHAAGVAERRAVLQRFPP